MEQAETVSTCLFCGKPFLIANLWRPLTCSIACSRELIAKVKHELEPPTLRRPARSRPSEGMAGCDPLLGHTCG
jgi:hypothetical protein